MSKQNRVSLSRTVAPGTIDGIKELAEKWDCSEGEAIDRAISKARFSGSADSPALLEVLEHVRTMAGTLPTAEGVEQVIDSTMRRIIDERKAERQPAGNGFDPRTVPGVQVGAQNTQPRRESGSERVERERRERQNRTAALDPSSAGREDIDRSDEFVSG